MTDETELTAEERAAWRKDAMPRYGGEVAALFAGRILRLLDALDARERLTTDAAAWRCASCQRDGLPTVDCPRCGCVGGTGCVYACEHCGHTFDPLVPASTAEPSREGAP